MGSAQTPLWLVACIHLALSSEVGDDTWEPCFNCLNQYCGAAHNQNPTACNNCLVANAQRLAKCGHHCVPKGQQWCASAPQPHPPPPPPPPPHPHPSPSPPAPVTWPSFGNQAALQASPWSKYFGSLYGGLPSTYPLFLVDFWCFYLDKMQAAGATPPKSVGTCPTSASAPTGQRYDENNAYSSKDLTWLWHPLNDAAPYTGFPPHSIVEVSHKEDPFGDETHGMWFVYAKGSGVFLDVGVTKVFNDHQDAYGFFGANSNPDMCQKAASKGFDSVQFIRHADAVSYPCAKGQGVPWMNMEIVAVKLIGTYSCGQAQGTASALRSGWNGNQPCKCDPKNPNTNCVYSAEDLAANSTSYFSTVV